MNKLIFLLYLISVAAFSQPSAGPNGKPQPPLAPELRIRVNDGFPFPNYIEPGVSRSDASSLSDAKMRMLEEASGFTSKFFAEYEREHGVKIQGKDEFIKWYAEKINKVETAQQLFEFGNNNKVRPILIRYMGVLNQTIFRNEIAELRMSVGKLEQENEALKEKLKVVLATNSKVPEPPRAGNKLIPDVALYGITVLNLILAVVLFVRRPSAKVK